jgi:glycosyltransferase involved in cell wall biosynthesis
LTNAAREPFPARILTLLGGFVTVGGAERMTFAAFELFRERGSLVHCIVNDWENEAIVAQAEKIGATWSEGSYKYRLRWRNRSFADAARGAFGTIATSRDLMRQVARWKPDVILAPDFEVVLRNAAALAFLRARGLPVVLYLQNAPPPSRRYQRLFRWIIDPLVTNYATASVHSARELEKIGIRASKISYVNNFAPSRGGAEPSVDRDPKKIVFVGQMIPQKGLDILLDAFRIVAAHDPAARLDVVSKKDGWIAPEYSAHRDSILSGVEDDDLRGRVTLMGWRDDVPRLLARAAVHCSPSRPEMHEGMPLVCLEAKVAGTPTVAPAHGPFEELITHRNDGWLCSDLSPASVAAGLRYFLDDPTRARAAGLAARESSSRFSRSEFARRWEAVFAAMTKA